VNELLAASIPHPPVDLVALMAPTDARAAQEAQSPARAEKVAKDFESVLLGRLLEEMDRTIPESGLLEGSTTRQVKSMYWSLLAGEMARQGGLGLWKQVHHSALRQYSAAQGDAPATLEPSS